jgi:hypothetical protein
MKMHLNLLVTAFLPSCLLAYGLAVCGPGLRTTTKPNRFPLQFSFSFSSQAERLPKLSRSAANPCLIVS